MFNVYYMYNVYCIIYNLIYVPIRLNTRNIQHKKNLLDSIYQMILLNICLMIICLSHIFRIILND
jgi:hypothetical protein